MAKWKTNLQKSACEWLTAHPDVSKSELARRAGIDKAMVMRVTSGERNDVAGETAMALAGAMGLSVEDLYAGRSTSAVTAPAIAPADGAGDVQMFSLRQLVVNPSNPRKTFDAEALAELAESIFTHGILQNLVAAPASKDGRNVVIAGGRRQRALIKLAEAGRWDENAPNIPVRVLAGDDARVLALAIVENLQRVELSPMEEAEAFTELQQLDATVWTTARIAETVHRTQRFVQQRLALATKLTAKAKKAISDGTISVETARVLTMAPMKRQAEIIGEIERAKENGWGMPDADDIRERLVDGWVPVKNAAFDPALYTGEIVTDEETGERYFNDAEAFNTLQCAAAEAKAAEYEGKRAWVKIVDHAKGQHFNSYEYNTSKRKDLSDTGVVIKINYERTIEILDGQVKRVASGVPQADAPRGARVSGKEAGEQPAPEPYTNALLVHARRTKSAALQDRIAHYAFADNGDTVITLAIIGLLRGDESYVKIDTAMRQNTDQLQGRHVGQRLAHFLSLLNPKRNKSNDEERVTFDRIGHLRIETLWDKLRAWEPRERMELFSLLVADQCGFFVGYSKPPPHHNAFDLKLAAHLEFDMTAVWRPDDAWLDGSRKARLEAFARAIRLEPIPKSTVQLRAAIKKRFADAHQGGAPLPPPEEWVPPEVRILDAAGFKEAFKASNKEPGERRSRGADGGEEARP
ncbi:ParB/RepB/Spo0J family partition protein [Vineibacter terrae]|uniref:ParB/RepB/Spo0J family partition protein n=1 Tax=Vineibacter terrae TaxID=2586908 RepID=UPI002E34D8D9|nr:ParB/RepB/Spo0J family partition protein [Vineibacter terrae]HEX2886801.1 ParB/RepB/Spo0J family partition protein [Vineibacter terrae]